MHFDSFYQTVGTFGRYQKTKFFLICLTYMLPPIMVYSWTFTAATPSFHCRTTAEDINVGESSNNLLHHYPPSESQCREYQRKISITECQRCYQSVNKSNYNDQNAGSLHECTGFVFDRTYYQSTLVEEWSMVCDGISYKSFAQTTFFLGYMIGSLVFGALSDKFGRRPIMAISFLIISVASFICAFAPQQQLGFHISYALFVFGRFLLACASRGVALSGFVIGIEIVGPTHRLFTGIVIEYFFALGELILLVFAFLFRTWRSLQIAIAILSIPFLFFYFLLPESPRWLISRGHYDEAEKVLRQIAETNKNIFDASAYRRLVTAEKKRENSNPNKGHGLLFLFQSKIMCIIAFNMSFQWFIQNLIFYGVSQNTGAWLINPYISFAVGAFVEIIAYIVVHLVLDRWGRKTVYSSFAMGFIVFSLLVLPIQMLMIKNSSGQYILMFIINVILKFFASGSYAIIYIYANELFPTQVRNTGIGICSMVARLGAIVGTLSIDILTRVWVHFPIVIYGITSAIAIAFITICPETLDKALPQTIEDVETMGLALSFRKSKLPPVRKSHVVDLEENTSLNDELKTDAV